MPGSRYAAVASALLACCARSATAAEAPAAGSAVLAGSLLQVLLGLVVVLALVIAAAWMLKRFTSMGGTGSGLVRIVGGAAVGQRERIVLVEVGGSWLLVGVAPGQVRALHTMPRPESAAVTEAAAAQADAAFPAWLRRMTEKRNHG